MISSRKMQSRTLTLMNWSSGWRMLVLNSPSRLSWLRIETQMKMNPLQEPKEGSQRLDGTLAPTERNWSPVLISSFGWLRSTGPSSMATIQRQSEEYMRSLG
ncbi:hypothetical protein HYQ46_001429 [Verticillium longisporum]|nr:hypothetical protein HYQ44_004455 [Verticillium longisporum]KAG7152993.1 hypothetical protein HYQ46_001429 [Verticillium longisporum]